MLGLLHAMYLASRSDGSERIIAFPTWDDNLSLAALEKHDHF
jgi:hypothetical protein